MKIVHLQAIVKPIFGRAMTNLRQPVWSSCFLVFKTGLKSENQMQQSGVMIPIAQYVQGEQQFGSEKFNISLKTWNLKLCQGRDQF